MMTSPILLTVACMRLLRLCVNTGKRVATGRMVAGRYVPMPRSEKKCITWMEQVRGVRLGNEFEKQLLQIAKSANLASRLFTRFLSESFIGQ